jgi:ATP-dependent protease HslVU (ClpYQ) peptidase subunit
MTCIVGIVDAGTVYMGGDSAGSNGYDLRLRKDRKVFVNNGFVIGFTSSFRMGQILNYGFTPPPMKAGQDLMAYMVTDFVNAVRDVLKNGGYARKTNEEEQGGVFLVGYQGRLFKIESDYQVGEIFDGFDACGCGEAYAMGALAANGDLLPLERIKQALEIASRYSAGVSAPFHTEVAR